MDALRKFRCSKCGIVDAAGCEQSGCPERPELTHKAELKCMSCCWQGAVSETAMFGSVSMLCPDCGAATASAELEEHVLKSIGEVAVASADSHPELTAGIVGQIAPGSLDVLDSPAPAGAASIKYIFTSGHADFLPEACDERRFAVVEIHHPDDLAIDRFAAAMKAKMAASRAKGRGGWDDPTQCSIRSLQSMLLEHLGKGDPVDVGNFAMMLFNRGAGTIGWKAVAVMVAERDAQQGEVCDCCKDIRAAEAIHGDGPDSAQQPTGWTLHDAVKAAHRIMNYPAWPRLPLPVQREVQAILFTPDRVPDSAQVAGKDGAK